MSDPRGRKHARFTNRDIGVMAIYQLGGALRYVHVEDAAIKAWELSPGRFSWKKYPDRINLELARLALKNELGSTEKRVLGGIRDGWMLTPSGLIWCLTVTKREDDGEPLAQLHREVERARQSEAFRKVGTAKTDDVSSADIQSLLRVNEYFTARSRKERVVALANAAVIDPRLQPVVAMLRDKGFADMEVQS